MNELIYVKGLEQCQTLSKCSENFSCYYCVTLALVWEQVTEKYLGNGEEKKDAYFFTKRKWIFHSFEFIILEPLRNIAKEILIFQGLPGFLTE